MDQEQAYLEKVMNLLNKQKEEYSDRLSQGKNNVIKMQKVMREEVNMGHTWDDIYEQNAMNAQIDQCVYGYAIDHDHWQQLKSELDSPYFGRIDFLEDGEDSEDIIYIGTYAIKDMKSFRYYVYDWRSPIASMYYDYELGEASYDAPIGSITGTINKKRQYKISNGVMQYWFDTDTNIEDELLAKALSENTDGKLKVIVSSIQKEQNKVIRAMNSDVLYVFGPAGSGKTSVGLHRLAYLLYHNRGKLDAKNIVIVANNEIFSSYVSNILPDLGEEEAVMGVFFDYMKQQIGEEYQLHDFYEMMENIMTIQSAENREHEIRRQGIQLKSCPEFLLFMRHYMETYPLKTIDLMYETEQIAPAKEMEHYLKHEFTEHNVEVSMNQVFECIERVCEEFFEKNQELVLDLYWKKTGDTVLEDDAEVFCYKEKRKAISENKGRFEEANHLNMISLYLDLLQQYLRKTDGTPEIYEQTKRSLEQKQLCFEDGVVLLCLQVLLGKIKPDLHIKQVLIDEAQDFNVLQMYFLKSLYPKSKFTILADSNQALESGFSTRNLSSFQNVFSGKQQVCQLTKSYRSTAPINRLANQLLGSEEKIEFVERSGKLPQLVCTDDFTQSLSKIIKKEQEEKHSIGILVYDQVQARRLYEALSKQYTVQKITDAQSELLEDIVILPLAYAKGLEFDCVIGAGDFTGDSVKWQSPNTMYLLCTRALHRLYLLSSVGVPKVLQRLMDYVEVIQDENINLCCCKTDKHLSSHCRSDC